MKRIVFHIGTHKTATTTIQHTLAVNRDTLQRQGIWYAITDRPPHPHPNKHDSLFQAFQKGPAAVRAECDILWNEFEASGCHTLLLSTEHLSVFPPNRLAWSECFAEKGRVEVVCLLRRQDILLESMWNQVIKNEENVGTIDQYYQKPHITNLLRYDLMLQAWRRFSDVSVLSFDAAKKCGVMRSFCEAARVPVIDDVQTLNISPSMNCAFMLLDILQAGAPMNKHRIIQAFREDNSRHVLGARLRREVLESMSECNRWLEHEYNIRFNDDLPDEQEEPVMRPDPEVIARAVAWLSHRPDANKL